MFGDGELQHLASVAVPPQRRWRVDRSDPQEAERGSRAAAVQLVGLHRGEQAVAVEQSEEPVAAPGLGRIGQPLLESDEPVRVQSAAPDRLHAPEVRFPLGIGEVAQHGPDLPRGSRTWRR